MYTYSHLQQPMAVNAALMQLIQPAQVQEPQAKESQFELFMAKASKSRQTKSTESMRKNANVHSYEHKDSSVREQSRIRDVGQTRQKRDDRDSIQNSQRDRQTEKGETTKFRDEIQEDISEENKVDILSLLTDGLAEDVEDDPELQDFYQLSFAVNKDSEIVQKVSMEGELDLITEESEIDSELPAGNQQLLEGHEKLMESFQEIVQLTSSSGEPNGKGIEEIISNVQSQISGLDAMVDANAEAVNSVATTEVVEEAEAVTDVLKFSQDFKEEETTAELKAVELDKSELKESSASIVDRHPSEKVARKTELEKSGNLENPTEVRETPDESVVTTAIADEGLKYQKWASGSQSDKSVVVEDESSLEASIPLPEEMNSDSDREQLSKREHLGVSFDRKGSSAEKSAETTKATVKVFDIASSASAKPVTESDQATKAGATRVPPEMKSEESVRTPVKKEALENQLFNEMVKKASFQKYVDGKNVIKLQLKPEHLGQMKIEVISEKGSLAARFLVKNEETREQVKEILADLGERLAETGLSLDAMDVDIDAGQESAGDGSEREGKKGDKPGSLNLEFSEVLEEEGVPLSSDSEVDVYI